MRRKISEGQPDIEIVFAKWKKIENNGRQTGTHCKNNDMANGNDK